MRLLLLLAVIFGSTPAAAQKARKGVADISEYYASLRQPDYPRISCCGEADAYWADQAEPCRPTDGPNCALVAIITDTREDAIELPNGKTINRMHVEPGTRVVVPKSKMRDPVITNPTDHTVVFLSIGMSVLCYEPIGGV